jgi:hypothetical protein
MKATGLSKAPTSADAAASLAAAITEGRWESVPHLLSLLMRLDPGKAGVVCESMLAALPPPTDSRLFR